MEGVGTDPGEDCCCAARGGGPCHSHMLSFSTERYWQALHGNWFYSLPIASSLLLAFRCITEQLWSKTLSACFLPVSNKLKTKPDNSLKDCCSILPLTPNSHSRSSLRVRWSLVTAVVRLCWSTEGDPWPACPSVCRIHSSLPILLSPIVK